MSERGSRPELVLLYDLDLGKKLGPCKNCGQRGAWGVATDEDNKLFLICHACKVAFGPCDTPAEMIALWNDEK